MTFPLAEHDPIAFAARFWPNVYFYDKQKEILRSLWLNDETVVVAGNMLGKDYLAGFACLWRFLHPDETRIVTTSVNGKNRGIPRWPFGRGS